VLKWANLKIDDHQIKNCPFVFEIVILIPFGTEIDLKTTGYGAEY
jgi:hypothetical protein